MEAKKKLSLTQETLKNLTQNDARQDAERHFGVTHTCACTCAIVACTCPPPRG